MTDESRPWHPMCRQPRPWTLLVLRRATDGAEFTSLIWCAHRDTFTEPITNREALPVIGDCDGWRYQ